MKTILLVFSLLGLAVTAGADGADTVNKTRSAVRKIEVDKHERSYRLYIPSSLPDAPAALVIVLHGGGSTAKGIEPFTGFSELAEREKFIVAYPDGHQKHWNDGRIFKKTRGRPEVVDDVAFMTAMIDAIARERRIDTKRIYATGISNGGIFAHYLAANRAELIAAIAPVAGGMADPFYKHFAPKQPVSVLVIQGTQDPLVPFDGGEVAWGRGDIISTDDAVDLWVEHNGITQGPTRGTYPDKDTGDGCSVKWSRWSNGRNGTEVMLLTLDGGGHTWPGGSQYLSERIIGKTCRDFDATAEIWEFFKAHPKP